MKLLVTVQCIYIVKCVRVCVCVWVCACAVPLSCRACYSDKKLQYLWCLRYKWLILTAGVALSCTEASIWRGPPRLSLRVCFISSLPFSPDFLVPLRFPHSSFISSPILLFSDLQFPSPKNGDLWSRKSRPQHFPAKSFRSKHVENGAISAGFARHCYSSEVRSALMWWMLTVIDRPYENVR